MQDLECASEAAAGKLRLAETKVADAEAKLRSSEVRPPHGLATRKVAWRWIRVKAELMVKGGRMLFWRPSRLRMSRRRWEG